MSTDQQGKKVGLESGRFGALTTACFETFAYDLIVHSVPAIARQGVDASEEVIRGFCKKQQVLELVSHLHKQLQMLWENESPRKNLPSPISPEGYPKTAGPLNAGPDSSSSEGSGPKDSPRPLSLPATPPLSGSPAADGCLGSNVSPSTLKPGQIPQAGSTAPPTPTLKIAIQLPNARVGVDYREQPIVKSPAPFALELLDIALPEGMGLRFDKASLEVVGVPLAAGQHTLAALLKLPSGNVTNADAKLVVNPDPRSLWQVNEPPAGSLFQKPHAADDYLKAENFRIVAGSRRGRSHEHAGSFRDDDFAIWHDATSGWSAIVVADGAGSAQFSREGSRIASETFRSHLAAKLNGDTGKEIARWVHLWSTQQNIAAKHLTDEFYAIYHEAAVCSLTEIESTAAAQNARPKDFSTTLLAAAVLRSEKSTFVAAFWIGDGAIGAYGPRGKVRLMGTPDGGEFAGQTRFLDRALLSDPSFPRRLTIGRFDDVTAVALMTDGVSDPKFETDQALSDGGKWDALWDELSPCLVSPNPAPSLVTWLNFFSPGNHDDRTIALLW